MSVLFIFAFIVVQADHNQFDVRNKRILFNIIISLAVNLWNDNICIGGGGQSTRYLIVDKMAQDTVRL